MNNCYYFNTQDQVTWSEARTECNIRNSDLLFIANSEEKVSYKGFVWGPSFVVQVFESFLALQSSYLRKKELIAFL